MAEMLFSFLLWIQLIRLIVLTNASRPNIVFLVADDMGWNDIGFHNPELISPNLDQLARSGIILNQNYVQPMCSPSRSAFMAGYYPFRMGLQHDVILNGQAVCLPLNKTILPQILKQQGYATHALGKWHLGFCNWNCTPTYRGFDSFYGYYIGREDYYNKTDGKGNYDFRNGVQVDRSVANNYSMYQYADKMEEIIHRHNSSKQLFLYLPMQTVHAPVEVPQRYYDLYPNITSKPRRIFSGMVTALDDVVGRLVKALKNKNLYDNTIIFFTSDNGGAIHRHGNNYPLRGAKQSIWEGGTRVPAFIHSPLLKNVGYKYEGLMHAVDWMSTIAEAAGIPYNDTKADGISHWSSIFHNKPSPRNEFIYNLDDSKVPTGKAAIRLGDYKLIDGYPGKWNDWYKPEHYGVRIPEYVSEYNENGMFDETLGIKPNSSWFKFKGLYNIKDDPHERTNLYDLLPDIVKKLRTRMEYYKQEMLPPNWPKHSKASNPDYWGGAWTPGWC